MAMSLEDRKIHKKLGKKAVRNTKDMPEHPYDLDFRPPKKKAQQEAKLKAEKEVKATKEK